MGDGECMVREGFDTHNLADNLRRAMLHDEEVYAEPSTFLPERFSAIDSSNVPPDPRAIIYGFGRRLDLIISSRRLRMIHNRADVALALILPTCISS